MKKQSLKNSHKTVFFLFGSPRKTDFLPPAARRNALEKTGPPFCFAQLYFAYRRTKANDEKSFLFPPLLSLSVPFFPCLFSVRHSFPSKTSERKERPAPFPRSLRSGRTPSFTALRARVSCRNRRIAHIRDWRYRVFSFCPRSCRKSARIPKTK